MKAGLEFPEFTKRGERVMNVMDTGALWERHYEPNLAVLKPGHQF